MPAAKPKAEFDRFEAIDAAIGDSGDETVPAPFRLLIPHSPGYDRLGINSVPVVRARRIEGSAQSVSMSRRRSFSARRNPGFENGYPGSDLSDGFHRATDPLEAIRPLSSADDSSPAAHSRRGSV